MTRRGGNRWSDATVPAFRHRDSTSQTETRKRMNKITCQRNCTHCESPIRRNPCGGGAMRVFFPMFTAVGRGALHGTPLAI
jgi:hypothetical protein